MLRRLLDNADAVSRSLLRDTVFYVVPCMCEWLGGRVGLLQLVPCTQGLLSLSARLMPLLLLRARQALPTS